jgi:4-amino-4-deoxy-L-arabinose transferase-like glycosyltransferase
MVAAFRLAIWAVDRNDAWCAALAGLLAAAAAASSLLTAPVTPVLLLWMMLYNRSGNRWHKFIAFVAGAIVAFMPLIWLLVKAPRQVMFNLIEFHLFYRGVAWEGATQHDLEVLTAWVDSTPALLLGLLAAAGVMFTIKNRQDRRWREELFLCFWLALALALYISTAHPTFERYFVLMVPFLGILGAVGFYEISSRLDTRSRPFWPVVVVAVLLCLGLAKALYERRDSYTWPDLEQVASKVDEVTAPRAPLLADEHIYFLTRRTPPEGLEFPDSQKLNLPAALAAKMHIVPRAEIAKRVQAGMFNTVETCADEDDERFTILGVPRVYSQKTEVESCKIFWDRRP